MANRLPRARIDELWGVYQEHQSVREAAQKCAVHHKTVERYRQLERWDERLAQVRRQAQEQADYDLARAMAESLSLVRAYKSKLAAALDAKKVDGRAVTAAELEKTIKLEAFILGGVESRQEIVGRFADWTDEQLEEYASTGKLPDEPRRGTA